jgi:membrane protein
MAHGRSRPPRPVPTIRRRAAQDAEQTTDRVVREQSTSRLPRLPAKVGRAAGFVGWLQRRPLIANYLRDDGDGLATIIAFSALFSLLPLLLVLFTIVGLVVQNAAVYQQVERLVTDLLPQTAADPILSVVEQGRDNLGQISLVALVALLLGGSRLFTALDNAFARIYRVERRPYLERKVVAMVMVPVVSILMIAAAAASTVATMMLAIPDHLFDTPGTRWVSGLLTLGVSYAAAYTMAYLLYATIPNYHRRGRRMVAWPGALVAAALFLLLSQLFPLYLRLTGGFGIFGGVFALALVLMIWLYLLGQIIVIGAEVNALASGRRDQAPAVPSVTMDSDPI